MKKLDLIINKELLEEFCIVNDFLIVTDEMLKGNNIYKDLVYATDNNFVGVSVYPSDMPIIMNKLVWDKLVKINDELKQHNLCLKIHDAYRPIEIQKMFWEYFYDTHGYYDETLVANPNKYGTHNITINAVDLFVVNLDGSKAILPCEFDDFTEMANIYFSDCSKEAIENRDLLINVAAKNGLIVNVNEWWHFYDVRLEEYGMKYEYSKSDFKPKMEEKVFILKNKFSNIE